MSLPEELTDAVYRAALEPAAWTDVMRLTKELLPSTAQTFYFLDLEPNKVRPVCLAGLDPRWLASFDALYFAADNPWMRVTKFLHRPGVVRTNERLDGFLRDSGALYRSAYYNDWMRPQGFKYTIGNTLLAEGGVIANVTLFRSPDMPTFDDGEVAAFERLSRHMTRSLQMATRLERTHDSAAGSAALDALPQAVAIVDARCRLLYANEGMETLLRRRHGLVLQDGRLAAACVDSRQRLDDFLARTVSGLPGDAAPLALPCGAARASLSLRAVPLAGAALRILPTRPAALLIATEHLGPRSVALPALRKLYGCTASEARLTQCLVEGAALRDAAQRLCISYETARNYLKLVFQKVGVHTQAQLVARVLGDLAQTSARGATA